MELQKKKRGARIEERGRKFMKVQSQSASGNQRISSPKANFKALKLKERFQGQVM